MSSRVPLGESDTRGMEVSVLLVELFLNSPSDEALLGGDIKDPSKEASWSAVPTKSSSLGRLRLKKYTKLIHRSRSPSFDKACAIR